LYFLKKVTRVITKILVGQKKVGAGFKEAARDFPLQHHVQTGSLVHSASYPKETQDSFFRG
jgi:hypothetical protein